MTSTHTQVLEALSGSMTEEGVSIYDVVKKLSTHGFSEKQIRYVCVCICCISDSFGLLPSQINGGFS